MYDNLTVKTDLQIAKKWNVKSLFERILKIIIFAILCVYAFLQIYPLIWMVLFSFKDNMEIFGGNVVGLPQIWRTSNYITAFTTGNAAVYFMNSVIITSLTIAISTILLTSSTYAIVRMKWKLKNVTMTYFLIGLMVPIHATLLPLFVILRNLHVLNTYMALIIPYVAFALPMGILIMTGFMHTIPVELEEAACLDGCNVYDMFIRIIVPLLRPAISTIAIFTYLASWNELMFANTFINSEKLKTLTVGILSMVGENSTDWGPIGAGLVIATIPTLIIYILLSDQVQKSLIVGAVKG